MKASLASTIAVLALGLGAGGVQAADNYLVQLDDTSSADTVTGNTYKNGALIQSVVFSGDRIVSSYGLWSGATVTSTFDNQYNYYEGDGVTLSDTVEISGNVGDTFITIAFNSDTDATPLTALASGGHFIEDGTFQPAVSPGTVSNGDFYDIQIASDVPEASTWAMMLVGAGLVGLVTRRRAAVALSA